MSELDSMFAAMESPSPLEDIDFESSSELPSVEYGMFSTESEIADSEFHSSSMFQRNPRTRSSKYSKSKIISNNKSISFSRGAAPEGGISQEDFGKLLRLPSVSSDFVNGGFEMEILSQSNLRQNSADKSLLKSDLNVKLNCEEEGLSNLMLSTEIERVCNGNLVSKYNETKTCEKEVPLAFGKDESNDNAVHTITKPLCSENCVPYCVSPAANELEHGSTIEVCANMEQEQSSRNKQSSSYSRRTRSKFKSTQKEPPDFDEDLLPFDIEKLLCPDYKPVESDEIYLKKLIADLDVTYSRPVVVMTRLEDMDPSLWKKYLPEKK